jgi:hypothetical protein
VHTKWAIDGRDRDILKDFGRHCDRIVKLLIQPSREVRQQGRLKTTVLLTRL